MRALRGPLHVRWVRGRRQRTIAGDREDHQRVRLEHHRLEVVAHLCARRDPSGARLRCLRLAANRSGIGVGSAPLADVPCMPELPRLIRLKYLTPLNRWTGLDVPVGLLGVATGGHPEAQRTVARAAGPVRRDRCGVGGIPMPIRVLGFPRPLA